MLTENRVLKTISFELDVFDEIETFKPKGERARSPFVNKICKMGIEQFKKQERK